MPGRRRRVARRRARLRSRSTPRGASRLALVRSLLEKPLTVGNKSVFFSRSCVRSARVPFFPAQPPQLRTPTCRPRKSQARPVGRLPLRLPTPENLRVPRLLRRQAQAASPRTRLRTPRLDNLARAYTRVITTLRSSWRLPIGKRGFDPPTAASSPYWTIAPTS